VFGRYKKVELIGHGGYGEVWKAYDFFTRSYVAVKFLVKRDADSLKMFQREIRELLNLVNNPNIVNITDSNVLAPVPFYVMEFCDGGSMRNQVGKITAPELIGILKAMAVALTSLHQRGGFQRDIKPDNILKKLVKNGYVCKLADFGLARTPNLFSAMTRTPGGTENYMDPETLRGKEFSPASDIYSLGITAFELLTGTPQRQWFLSVDCPVNLHNLILEMTNPDATYRPTIEHIEERLITIEKERSQGFPNILSAFSYNELAVGGVATALFFSFIFGGNKS
jgi:serine/threonine-protein kinase